MSKYKNKLLSILCITLLLGGSLWQGIPVQAAAPNIYHVKVDGDSTNDGSSWANAFDSLQVALDKAKEEGDQIWIAAGTYYPTKQIDSTFPRSISFQMKNGVAIYGGFVGDDTNETVESRDWKTNKTILSGDLDKNDDSSDISLNKGDNAYHVFYHPKGTYLDNTAVLDGVSIVGGNANGENLHNRGGGMYNEYSHPKLTNVTISDNNAYSGGGMFNSSDSGPVLTNVTISNNTTYGSGSGGGMFNNYGSYPELTNVTINDNIAYSGGGMFNSSDSRPELTNVTISNNTTGIGAGGGMFNDSDSHPKLTNVTISNNNANGNGGGIYNHSDSAELTNVTISFNNTNRSGGGMFNDVSDPVLTDVTLIGNTASDDGGGMFNNWGSDPELTNMTLSSNTAGRSGGGMFNYVSDPVLTDVTLSGNTANDDGGGMYNSHSNPELTNVTLSGNGATNNGGISNDDYSSPIVSNSIIWGNASSIANVNSLSKPTFTNSIIEGSGGSIGWNKDFGEDQGGNLDGNPRFVDSRDSSQAPTLEGDYRLLPSSPAIPGKMGAWGIYELIIAKVEEIEDLSVQRGTDLAAILPQEVEVTDETDETIKDSLEVEWDAGTPTFNRDTPGTYSFEGQLASQDHVTNPRDLIAKVDVVIEIPKVTGVDSITTISVPLGTTDITEKLPLTIGVTLSDQATPIVPVLWDTSGFNGKQLGTYSLTGKLTPPSDTVNPDKINAKMDVIVGPAEVFEVLPIGDIHVAYGTNLTNADLPATVNVTLSDETTENIPVIWDEGKPTYKDREAGTYTFKGQLDTQIGNPGNKIAEVNVIVELAEVAEVAPISDIRVAYGTDLTNTNLPATVDVTLSDKTKEKVSVSWDIGMPAYNGRKPGTYLFKGQLDPTIVKPTNIIAEVNVIVRSRPTPPPLNIQATMTADQALTEEQLDGSTLTINVSDTNFMVSLTPEYFELQNAPIGLTIREVIRMSASQVELTLAFDGTQLEQDHNLGLMIHGAALTNGFNVAVNNTVQIKKSTIPEPDPNPEKPYKTIIKEGTFEPTKVWTVKLSNEVDPSTMQDALYIVDTEGNRLPAVFTSEANQIFIHPPAEHYADGTYTLYITPALKDVKNRSLKEPIQMFFTIESIKVPELEETYETIIEEGTFPSDKVWTIDLLTDIDPATLESGMFLEDENGNIVPITFTIDGTNIIVQAPVEGYEAGTYTLYITSQLKDIDGNPLQDPTKMIFTIESVEEQ